MTKFEESRTDPVLGMTPFWGNTLLVQACANASDPTTLEREVRSLIEAKPLHPKARTLLILLDPLPPDTSVLDSVELIPATQWFLEAPEK
jgi:hypothetical protein